VGATRHVHGPADADAGRAYELLAPSAVDAVVTVLDELAANDATWLPQEGEATYAAKIGAADKRIDWTRPAAAIVDQVRALSPHIGAVTELLGRRTRIWRAAAGAGPLSGGARDRLVLPAGEGWVEVLELQPEGARRMPAEAYLRGAGRALVDGP
jgi:methionyl-tRNA formyltransferase